MSDKLKKEFDKWAIKNDVAYEFAAYINAESEHKIKVLRDALELIANYPNVQNIVGHWAEKALKDTE